MLTVIPFCFESIDQPFLVCVTIHKARNLIVLNENTFVLVSYNGTYRRTRTFRNSDCPYFNEFFTFETKTSLENLLKTSISVAIFSQTCCSKRNRCIGEFSIDLKTIWENTHHAFLQKWAVLENPAAATASQENAGFLQLDLSIVSSSQPSIPAAFPAKDTDIIEGNLLAPLAENEGLQRVKYYIKNFRGMFTIKSDYIMEVCFGGIQSRTKIARNCTFHEWNEQLVFIGTFPSLSQLFIFNLLINECCYKRSIAKIELPFSKLSEHIDGVYSLPAFGPNYIYFYNGHQDSNFVGSLLLEIGTEIYHNRSVAPKLGNASPIIAPLNTATYWTEAEFVIRVAILNVLVFDSSKPATVKISLNCLANSSNSTELKLIKMPISKVRYANFQEFEPLKRPVLEVTFKCPDVRWKLAPSIALYRIGQFGKYLLDTYQLFRIENGAKSINVLKIALGSVCADIHAKLLAAKGNLYAESDKRLTHWDRKWMLFLNEQIESLITCLREIQIKSEKASTAEDVQSIHNELTDLITILTKISTDNQNTFPAAFIRIRQVPERRRCTHNSAEGCTLNCGKPQFSAICRINVIDYLLIPTEGTVESETGVKHAKRSSILAKPFMCQHSCAPEWCGCVYAKLDVAIWAGTLQEATEWDKQQSGGHQNRDYPVRKHSLQCHESSVAMKCTVNVHQAKIQAGFDKSGLSDPKLTVIFERAEMTTSVIPQTLSPLWNEVIEFRNVKMLKCNDWFQSGESTLMLHLQDEDKPMCSQISDETIGIGWYKCTPKALIEKSSGDVNETSGHDHAGTMLLSGNQSSLLLDRKQGSNGQLSAENRKTNNTPDQRPPEVSNKTYRTKMERDSLLDLWREFNVRKDSVLRWVGVYQNGQRLAAILMSAELEQIKLDVENAESVNRIQGIPKEICPITEKYHVEVLFAGLRQLDKSKTNSIGRFRVQLNFGELKLTSGISCKKFGKSINFLDIYAKGILMLPIKHEYWPPIIIQHMDCSQSNKLNVVGANIIENPEAVMETEDSKSIQHYLLHSSGGTPTHAKRETISTETDFFGTENSPLVEAKHASVLSHKVRPALLAFRAFVENKLKTVTKVGNQANAVTFRRGSTEAEYTWWTKFYNSCSSQPCDYKHKLKLYPCELEKVPEFEQFQDWSSKYALSKKTQQLSLRSVKPYAQLKCKIWITPSTKGLPPSKQLNPLSNFRLRSIPALVTVSQLTVVVYIVQGLNLRSRDIFSLSDAYVTLEYGKQKIVDRPNYVKDRSNPIFGRRFVLHGEIPRDQILRISIVDRDTCSPDDLIGTTEIDIEDRFRSRHCMCLGFPEEYSSNGYNAWRHPSSPSELLEKICNECGIIAPNYVGNVVQLAGQTFYDESTISVNESLRERLALTALKNFQRIPVLGSFLVPEHVETRALFHSDHPGIEQGKLQLWIEIYPTGCVPTLLNITPNPPKAYELRVIVWNTADVILDEKNIFGTRMSDIYVKCWLQCVEESQLTDIHYRSLDGTGNFNWRMIFPLNYSSAETMMVVRRKKSFYEQLETEEKVPPLLTVQVWDNDLFSRDDFLGTLNLNLAHLPQPATKPSKCILQTTMKSAGGQDANLFRVDKLRGWYPIVGKVDNKIVQTGKIELELEVLTEEEAILRPAGRGRKSPQSLPAPSRPDASFNWYRNPLKSLRVIVWPTVRRAVIIGSIVALIVLVCIGVIRSFPASVVNEAFARKASLERTVRTGQAEEEQESA
ncbi:fer-1-like protein 6 [Sabethes cyaneus]|uniref:fer-1-like protein 6 n=1 Tax=Sabethes cyaneus TaxID=53552 RepID=UPI00237EA53A|nr:fer-1-like protein 6 [Sabethes cyaneus]